MHGPTLDLGLLPLTFPAAFRHFLFLNRLKSPARGGSHERKDMMNYRRAWRAEKGDRSG